MAPPKKIPHKSIPEWLGEASINDPKFVVWDTNDGVDPKITHNRDLMVNGGLVEQDYKFLDYDFGTITARVYLDEPHIAYVELGERGSLSGKVALYLKTRFNEIQVLGQDGYEVFWRS